MNHPALRLPPRELRVVPRDIALDHITHCSSPKGEREMGYEILIGEWDASAVAGEEGCAPQTVACVEVDEAPSFDGDAAGRTNRRQPSYTAWERFCRSVGLHALFFDRREGLMREHPGTALLTWEHARQVRVATGGFTVRHPNVKPGFHAGVRSEDLARLLWLSWWIEWALRTCERPALHNR